jgi:uncharacterized protein (DUF1778 family)
MNRSHHDGSTPVGLSDLPAIAAVLDRLGRRLRNMPTDPVVRAAYEEAKRVIETAQRSAHARGLSNRS